MAEDDSQKTEEPTPKKLEKARSEGQVAQSRDLNSWVYLLVATILIATAFPFLFGQIARIFVQLFHFSSQSLNGAELFQLMRATLISVAIYFLPIMLAFLLAALGVSFAQYGLLFAPKKMQPKLSNMSPLKGLKKIFSAKALVEFVKGILKVVIVFAISYFVISGEIDIIINGMQMHIMEVLPVFVTVFLKLMSAILIFLFFLAMFDVAWQNYNHIKGLRMSRQEVKDERKQQEGSPEIKQRIAKIRNERARQKILESVPEADVVVTNPTHYAVALKYDPSEMAAPVITAKGLDKLALKIREIANDNNVSIVENPPLARALYDTGEVDQEIDPDYYEAVAAVIKYVWGLKNKKIP